MIVWDSSDRLIDAPAPEGQLPFDLETELRRSYLEYAAAVLSGRGPHFDEVGTAAPLLSQQRPNLNGVAVMRKELQMRPVLAKLKRPSPVQRRTRSTNCFFGSVKVNGRNAP